MELVLEPVNAKPKAKATTKAEKPAKAAPVEEAPVEEAAAEDTEVAADATTEAEATEVAVDESSESDDK
jgi:large subunit ribosomal protein L17